MKGTEIRKFKAEEQETGKLARTSKIIADEILFYP
jgi:hypothetical protein